MEADLNLKCSITVLFVNLKVLVADEGDLLIGCLGRQNVAEGDVLETFRLPDIIVLFVWHCQQSGSLCDTNTKILSKRLCHTGAAPRVE